MKKFYNFDPWHSWVAQRWCDFLRQAMHDTISDTSSISELHSQQVSDRKTKSLTCCSLLTRCSLLTQEATTPCSVLSVSLTTKTSFGECFGIVRQVGQGPSSDLLHARWIVRLHLWQLKQNIMDQSISFSNGGGGPGLVVMEGDSYQNVVNLSLNQTVNFSYLIVIKLYWCWKDNK